jgi:putative addiction module component (TIGR02574 family)
MNAFQISQLQKLSFNEKIEVIQILWDDIAKEHEKLHIPDEHIKILEERLKIIGKGKAKFRSWESIRAKYLAT